MGKFSVQEMRNAVLEIKNIDMEIRRLDYMANEILRNYNLNQCAVRTKRKVFMNVELNTKVKKYVFKVVEDYSGVSSEHYCRKTREKEIVLLRQVCVTLMIENTNFSLKEIAKMFMPAISDHTTAMHCRDVIKDLCDTDEFFKNDIDRLRSVVNTYKTSLMINPQELVQTTLKENRRLVEYY